MDIYGLKKIYRSMELLNPFFLRFQVQPVTRKKLQLVGVTAMLVACKYEEMYVPLVGDFAYIADDAFTKAQIREMEMLILSELNFELGRPLPLHFLRRASKAGNASTGFYNHCGLAVLFFLSFRC